MKFASQTHTRAVANSCRDRAEVVRSLGRKELMGAEDGADRLSFCIPSARRIIWAMTRVLLLAALLWVCACSPGQDMNTTTNAPMEEGEPYRKLNPAPKRGYVITMTLNEAPGPFASIEGVAQYTVENSVECGKRIPIAGAFPRISTSEPFNLTRVSEGEFRGTVYADLVLDEDYFGRGVCRWRFSSVSVHLRATTNDADTRFIPSIDSKAVISSRSASTYFWKGRYPQVADYAGFPEFGDSNLERIPREKLDEFFTITLASVEASP